MTSTRIAVTNVTKDSPGAGQVTIVGTYTEDYASTATQRGLLGNFPSDVVAWSRALLLADEGLFVMKSGQPTVSWSIADLTKIAYSLEQTQTYPPGIATQPTAASCVASSTAAVFTIEGDSELAMTYQWQYSADGSTGWTNASGTVNGCAYSGGTSASLTCTPTTTGQTGYSHRCTITNAQGNVVSANAVLTIT